VDESVGMAEVELSVEGGGVDCDTAYGSGEADEEDAEERE